MILAYRFRNALSSLIVLALFIATTFVRGGDAHAVDATWNGSVDGQWSNVNNWNGPPASVPGTGNTATFDNAGGGNTTLDLGAGVTIRQITFNTGSAAAYTIGSGGVGAQTLTFDTNNSGITLNNTVANNQLFNANIVLDTVNGNKAFAFTNNDTTESLTLAGNITSTTTGTKTINLNTNTGGATISGNITNGTGTVNLVKQGAGTLSLSGSNAFNNLTINSNAGTVSLGSATALQGNTSLTMNINTTLDLNGNNASIGGVYFAGGAGTETISTGVGTLTVTGTSAPNGAAIGGDFSSTTRLISGKLNLAGASIGFNNGSGSMTVSADVSGNILDARGGNILFSGTNTHSATTLTGGTFQIGSAGALGAGTLTFANGGISSDSATPRTINNSVTFTANGAVGNATNNGLLTFSNGVNLNGSRTLTLNSDAQFDGIVSNGGLTTAGTGTLTVTNGSTNFSSGLTASGPSSGIGSTVRYATSNLVADNQPVGANFGGTLDLNGFSDTVGRIFFGSGSVGQTATISTGVGTLTITGAGGGNGNISGDIASHMDRIISGNLNFNGGTRTIRNDSNLATQAKMLISANISNGGAQILGGIVHFSGTNSYTLGTTVDAAGTLVYANTAAKPGFPSVTTVAANGTLGLGVGGGGFFNSTDVDALFNNTLSLVSMNATSKVGIDTTAGDFVHASNITQVGTKGLTKLGPNKLTLSGTNAYTGPTLVYQGTLELTGDNSAVTAATTVNSGATLSVTSASSFPGGTVSLSGGTLNYTGAATSTSKLAFVNNSGTSTIDIGSGSALSTEGGNAVNANLIKEGTGSLSICAPLFNGFATVNAGSLTFTAPQTFTGTTTVNSGMLTLAGGDHTLSANRTLVVNGGTLDLGANDQYVGNFSGTGGNITGSGRFTTNLTGNQTFAGNIGGTVDLVKVGNNSGRILTLTGDNTTTGTVSVLGGDNPQSNGASFGGMTLQDGGRLSGVTAINLGNSSLFINDNGTVGHNDRVNDLAPITLHGGRIMHTGRNNTASTESFGAVTASTGLSTISATRTGASGSDELTLASLTRNVGATLQFQGTNLGQLGSNGRIIVTGGPTGNLAPVNGVVPGAVYVQSADQVHPVGHVPVQGFGALGTAGFPAYYSPGGNNFAGAGPTSNVLGGGTVTTGTLTINSQRNGTISFTNATDTLILNSGMWVQGSNASFGIGSVATRGILTSGLSTGELFLFKMNEGGGGGAAGNIHSVIADNGGTRVKLILSTFQRADLNNQNANLTANNTHTGGTVVSGGNTVFLTATTGGDTPIPAAFDPTQGLIIDNSTVTMVTNAQQIAATNIVTLNGGSVLNLTGANNTLAGLVFNSNGGRGQIPTVAGGTQMTITGDISSTPTDVSVTPLINVTLDLNGSAAHDITVDAFLEGNLVNTNTPLNGLRIGSVIQNGGFTKKGDGVLWLAQSNNNIINHTYAGQLTIEEGVLNVGNTLNNINSNGALGNSANSVIMGGTGGKVGTIEYTGGTATNTKPYTMATGGAGGFQVDTSTTNLTLSAVINGDGGLVKSGPGTLTLTNSFNSYGGGTIVNAGTLTANANGTPLGATTGTLAVNNPYIGGTTAVVLNLTSTADTTTGTLSGDILDPDCGNTATINVLGSRLLTVNQMADATYEGVIAGAGGKFTLGALSTSTLTLTGNSTYTGVTNVDAGTLLVNGDNSAASGTVTVNSGGTLGGTGIVGGATTILAGGMLAPGASIGDLTIDDTLDIIGGVTASASQSLLFELGANPSGDQVTLTASNTLFIGLGLLEFDDFVFSGSPTAGTYTLFDTNTLISGTLGASLSGTIGSYLGTLAFGDSGNDIILTLQNQEPSAVPEPSTFVLAALGLAGLGLLGWRRKTTTLGPCRC